MSLNADDQDPDMPTPENTLEDGDLIERPSPDRKDFVPTLAKPLPSFQCTAIKSNGERCSNMAPMGMKPDNAKCGSHGAKLPSVKEAAAARCEAARLSLTDNVDSAIATLKALMEPGTADAVRLKAATEVLDRTIGRAAIDIQVTEEVTVNTSDQVRERLAALLENKLDPKPDIIDGEIVDEQETE